jgi:two-component system, LytTR family, response regulator
MKIRTVIVDDEPLAREGLRGLLASVEGIDVVGEFGSASEARGALAGLSADLLFLDVQMPRMTGLRFVEVLEPDPLPLVVFVTAHDSFAVEAFDTRAVDYLLKPVHPARLARAMERVRDQLTAMREPASQSARMGGTLPDEALRPISRLMCKEGERVLFIRVEDIQWIESAGNYVVVHTATDRHIVRETMASLEQGLPASQFVRLNRSLIVNLEAVVELRTQGQGDYTAILRGGRKASVTLGLRELEKRLRYG